MQRPSSLGQALQVIRQCQLSSAVFNGFALDDSGCSVVCRHIAHCPDVTSLDLQDNRIGVAGTISVANLLRTNSAIKCVRLSLNNVGNGLSVGIHALCEAIISRGTLESLYLRGNGLGPEAADPFARLLQACTKLKNLDLSNNNLGSIGARRLAEALEHNHIVESVVLHGNGADNRYLYKIERTLAKNKRRAAFRTEKPRQEFQNWYFDRSQRLKKEHNDVQENDFEKLYYQVQHSHGAADRTFATKDEKDRYFGLRSDSEFVKADNNNSHAAGRKARSQRQYSLDTASQLDAAEPASQLNKHVSPEERIPSRPDEDPGEKHTEHRQPLVIPSQNQPAMTVSHQREDSRDVIISDPKCYSLGSGRTPSLNRQNWNHQSRSRSVTPYRARSQSASPPRVRSESTRVRYEQEEPVPRESPALEYHARKSISSPSSTNASLPFRCRHRQSQILSSHSQAMDEFSAFLDDTILHSTDTNSELSKAQHNIERAIESSSMIQNHLRHIRSWE